MHELGLMQEILDIAQAEAQRQGARRIHRLTLRIGTLAGVEPEALAFAFDVATAGTLAEGAALTIDPVAVVCRCARCHRDFTPNGFVFVCPGCSTPSAEVLQGRELELAQVEVS